MSSSCRSVWFMSCLSPLFLAKSSQTDFLSPRVAACWDISSFKYVHMQQLVFGITLYGDTANLLISFRSEGKQCGKRKIIGLPMSLAGINLQVHPIWTLGCISVTAGGSQVICSLWPQHITSGTIKPSWAWLSICIKRFPFCCWVKWALPFPSTPHLVNTSLMV